MGPSTNPESAFKSIILLSSLLDIFKTTILIETLMAHRQAILDLLAGVSNQAAEQLINDMEQQEDRNKQFFKAVRHNDLAAVTRLLAEGANIEYVDQSHLRLNNSGEALPGQLLSMATALEVSCRNNNIEMATLLLNAGAQVFGGTLVAAIQHGNVEFIRLLISRNPAIARYQYALLEALRLGNIDILRLLLENGADPNAASYGIPALAQAVHRNNTECVRVLLEFNPDTTYTNRAGMNLFYHALSNNNLDIARLLLDVNPDLINSSYQRDLEHFISRGAVNRRGAAVMAWEQARRNRLSGYSAAAATPAASAGAGAGSNASANKKGGRRSTRKNLKKNRRH